MASPYRTQSRRSATSHNATFPHPNADPTSPQFQAQSPSRARRTPSTRTPKGESGIGNNADSPKPPKKPIHQVIKHAYTRNPPPQTSFLTLRYGAKIRDDLARILGSTFISGQRDWRGSRTKSLPPVAQSTTFTENTSAVKLNPLNTSIGRPGVNPQSPAKDSAIDVDTPCHFGQQHLCPTNAIPPPSGLSSTPAPANMAPVPMSEPTPTARIHDSLKEVVQNLYDMQSMVHGYAGSETHPHLVDKMIDLTHSLADVQSLARTTQLPSIPPELIDYVDEGRNPDIYTREFVELVQRGNAVVNGKKQAFAGFSQVFARKLAEEEVRRKKSHEGSQGQERGYVVDLERESRRVLRHTGLDGDERRESTARHGAGGMNGDVKEEE